MNNIFLKKKAFTLAEVLITLGIIGVVASLTIPALFNKTNDAELKTAFKKSYSNLQNAYNLIMYENGSVPLQCYYTWDTVQKNSECENFYIALKEKLKVSKEYHGAIYEGNTPKFKERTEIIADGGVAPNGSCSGTGNFERDTWVLADGSMIISYSTYFNTVGQSPVFIIDTNGAKKPNKWGYDVFMLDVKDKISNGYNMIIEDNICYTVEKGGYRINDILSQ